MKSFLKLYLVIFITCFLQPLLKSQSAPENEKRILHSEYGRPIGSKMQEVIFSFMNAAGKEFVWLKDQEALDQFISLIENCEKDGMDSAKYEWAYLQTLRNGSNNFQTGADSLEAELHITQLALKYFSDLAFGMSPAFSYDGLGYEPDCKPIAPKLAAYAINHSLPALKQELETKIPEVKHILEKLDRFITISGSLNYYEEKIVSPNVSSDNKPLLKKLYHLGFVDSVNKKMGLVELINAVRKTQRFLDVYDDGLLKPITLKELNVPLSTRIEQLKLSVNYYRWLSCLTGDLPVIVVNIPATYLKVYQENRIILEMRMVVGQPSTRTPTLASRVSEVILYPYWMVPNSIATKELLPAIRRNPAYLDNNGFQVIDKQGRRVNHYAVDWSTVSTSDFPYIIRQSTGCDNSLGILKINFYNPFRVYLHDTPGKSLFMLNRRFFSHGCMRMEKPLELGHLVLKNNAIAIDTIEEKGCLRNQSPIVVKADQKLPVIVWYNPAGTNKAGELVIFRDIYKRFNWDGGKL